MEKRKAFLLLLLLKTHSKVRITGDKKMDDWEYSDNDCPKCGAQTALRHCYECGGSGRIEDEDDEWGFDERCDNCNGKGIEEWCRECGWDVVFKHFLSPKYEAEWLAKQQGESDIPSSIAPTQEP